MLDDAERAELEEFRQQEKRDLAWGWVILAVIILAVGSCSVVAYRADAFIDGGISVPAVVRYYSKK